MKALLLIRRRVAFGNRDFAELVVWRVPEPVPPTTHGFKYRLVYIVDGQRVVGFDNERGKGDHKHVMGHETVYRFTSVEQMIEDFISEVDAIRRQR